MKKKSEEQKAIHNTKRKDRPSGSKPVPITDNGNLVPMSFLTARGKYYFNLLAQHLIKYKANSEIDTLLVSMAANSMALYEKYAKMIMGRGGVGPIQKFKTGAKNISAEYTVMKTEQKNLIEILEKLGVGPLAREKMITFNEIPKEGKQTVIAQFLESA